MPNNSVKNIFRYLQHLREMSTRLLGRGGVEEIFFIEREEGMNAFGTQSSAKPERLKCNTNKRQSSDTPSNLPDGESII